MNKYTTKNRNNKKPLRTEGGQVIGYVNGDTFKKSVYGSRHFLRNYQAIANDVTVLRQAENMGAVQVEIKDHETGIIYRASLSIIWKKGFKINHGYGEQWALSFKYWDTSGGNVRVKKPTGKKTNPPVVIHRPQQIKKLL